MKKINFLVYFILLILCLSSCNNEKISSLENKVSKLEKELSEVKMELNGLKNEINANTKFEKEMQCQEMLDRLKRRWSNIVGCYYSSNYNTCMVKYMKDGVVKESRIEDMVDD